MKHFVAPNIRVSCVLLCVCRVPGHCLVTTKKKKKTDQVRWRRQTSAPITYCRKARITGRQLACLLLTMHYCRRFVCLCLFKRQCPLVRGRSQLFRTTSLLLLVYP